jgi:hypothetical protein
MVGFSPRGNCILLNEEVFLGLEYNIESLLVHNGLVILFSTNKNLADRNIFCFNRDKTVRWQVSQPEKIHSRNEFTSVYTKENLCRRQSQALSRHKSLPRESSGTLRQHGMQKTSGLQRLCFCYFDFLSLMDTVLVTLSQSGKGCKRECLLRLVYIFMIPLLIGFCGCQNYTEDGIEGWWTIDSLAYNEVSIKECLRGNSIFFKERAQFPATRLLCSDQINERISEGEWRLDKKTA